MEDDNKQHGMEDDTKKKPSSQIVQLQHDAYAHVCVYQASQILGINTSSLWHQQTSLARSLFACVRACVRVSVSSTF